MLTNIQCTATQKQVEENPDLVYYQIDYTWNQQTGIFGIPISRNLTEDADFDIQNMFKEHTADVLRAMLFYLKSHPDDLVVVIEDAETRQVRYSYGFHWGTMPIDDLGGQMNPAAQREHIQKQVIQHLDLQINGETC